MKDDKLLHVFAIAAIFFLLLALIDSFARAEPYFICSPNDFLEVTAYQVELNGQIVNVDPSVINENRQQLVYDLIDIPVGASAIRARMKTKFWPWTEWSEPFTVIRPSPLTNPQIVSAPPSP